MPKNETGESSDKPSSVTGSPRDNMPHRMRAKQLSWLREQQAHGSSDHMNILSSSVQEMKELVHARLINDKDIKEMLTKMRESYLKSDNITKSHLEDDFKETFKTFIQLQAANVLHGKRDTKNMNIEIDEIWKKIDRRLGTSNLTQWALKELDPGQRKASWPSSSQMEIDSPSEQEIYSGTGKDFPHGPPHSIVSGITEQAQSAVKARDTAMNIVFSHTNLTDFHASSLEESRKNDIYQLAIAAVDTTKANLSKPKSEKTKIDKQISDKFTYNRLKPNEVVIAQRYAEEHTRNTIFPEDLSSKGFTINTFMHRVNNKIKMHLARTIEDKDTKLQPNLQEKMYSSAKIGIETAQKNSGIQQTNMEDTQVSKAESSAYHENKMDKPLFDVLLNEESKDIEKQYKYFKNLQKSNENKILKEMYESFDKIILNIKSNVSLYKNQLKIAVSSANYEEFCKSGQITEAKHQARLEEAVRVERIQKTLNKFLCQPNLSNWFGKRSNPDPSNAQALHNVLNFKRFENVNIQSGQRMEENIANLKNMLNSRTTQDALDSQQ
jgi:hypothetical protein